MRIQTPWNFRYRAPLTPLHCLVFHTPVSGLKHKTILIGLMMSSIETSHLLFEWLSPQIAPNCDSDKIKYQKVYDAWIIVNNRKWGHFLVVCHISELCHYLLCLFSEVGPKYCVIIIGEWTLKGWGLLETMVSFKNWSQNWLLISWTDQMRVWSTTALLLAT